MARGGIYKTEVLRARNNLLALGRYPSIDAIRSELGNTGSKTTIHRYLKEIEAEEGGKDPQPNASDAILDLASRLAERLKEEADQQVASLIETHNAEIAELQGRVAALTARLDSYREQAERLTLALADAQDAQARQQALLQQERLDNAVQRQKIADLERQLAETLEQYQAAAREQREQNERQSAQQVQFWQDELRSRQQALEHKQQELAASQHTNGWLTCELKQARAAFDAQHSELQTLQLRKQQLAGSASEIALLRRQLDQAGTREMVLVKQLRESIDICQRLTAAAPMPGQPQFPGRPGGHRRLQFAPFWRQPTPAITGAANGHGHCDHPR